MRSAVLQLQAYLDALVHPSLHGDALGTAQHRGFIASHLAVGAVGLAALPAFLAVHGAPGPAEAVLFAWLAAPIAVAALLSRNGRLDQAQILSAATLAGLVATAAALTGGLSSFAIPWLLLVPVEAITARAGRVLLAACALVVAVTVGIYGAQLLAILPAPAMLAVDEATLRFVSLLAAALYGCVLIAGAAHVSQVGRTLSRTHEARYQMLAQNMTGVITRHARSGGVVFVSPAPQALLGVTGERLLGNGLFERVHVADRPAYLSALAKAAREGSADVEFRVRHDHPGADDPAFLWVELRARAIDGWPGEPVEACGERQVVAVIRDISDRKQNELALDEARCAAENADRAKTRFLASMSHELRTPLNAIIGFSEILMSGEASKVPAERRAEYARLIHESGEHLLGVVNGILDLSRIESGGFELMPEQFDLRAVVSSCVAMLALKAEQAGIRLSDTVSTTLPAVTLDKRALRQIVLNLLSNSVKFTPRGGVVTVEADIVSQWLVLRVTDTGIGISEQDLRRLGQPFFQARSTGERPHEGTGLGLSVVKGLATLHGGRVEFESRIGGGTCVAVHLPLQDGIAACDPHTRIARLPRRLPVDMNHPQKKRA